MTVLGIDIGSSSIKLVCCHADGLMAAEQYGYGGAVPSAQDALAAFLDKLHLQPQQIHCLAATGIGSVDLGDTLLGIPLVKVDEFEAIARGGLLLSGLQEAIVVSMGTGTAFVRATGMAHCYLGGTSVGGGTLSGLCRHFYGLNTAAQIQAFARRGDLSRVNLQIRDLVQDASYPLPPEVTSSNLGKITPDATPEDLVLGFIHMIFENIGKMAMLYCRNDPIRNVVLIGSLTELPQAADCFAPLQARFGVQFILPPRAQFATAIGAVQKLQQMRHPEHAAWFRGLDPDTEK